MRAVAWTGLLGLAACGGGLTPARVAPPPDISVEKAFDDAANGIVGFRRTLAENQTSIGMVVCKIDVHFNIAAQATRDGKAGVDIAVPLEAAKIGANASLQNTSVGNRGNTVQITLGSVYPELCGKALAPAEAAGAKAVGGEAAEKPGAGKPAPEGGRGARRPAPAADPVAAARRDAEAKNRTMARVLELQREVQSLQQQLQAR